MSGVETARMDDTLTRLLEILGVSREGPFPIEAPGWTRDDLPRLLHKLGCRTGAEVGVWEGEFSEALCKGNPGVFHYAVDAWAPYPEYFDYRILSNLEGAYRKAMARLKPFGCRIVRATSQDAAKQILDRSLDYVYIDGNHAFGWVAMDLELWSRKVKTGGIIAGHDYHAFHPTKSRNQVIQAVRGFTEANQIEPWFVLGTRGEARCEPKHSPNCYQSYLWVNP